MFSALQRLCLPLHRLAHWPDRHAYQHAMRRWWMGRMLTRLDAESVRTVVEVGCGDGWATRELASMLPRATRFVGFDFNPLRIEPAGNDPRILLCAGDAEHLPIAPGSADLILSIATLEHLRDREAVLRRMGELLSPDGLMVQIVPLAPMKVLQWLGFIPEQLRKAVRGATRSLAGQRREKKRKYREGMETNNPHRRQRRHWYQKLYPRVHGEYDSNWQEFRINRRRQWERLFARSGLRLGRYVPLGLFSPYFFGLSPLAKAAAWVGLASVGGFILQPGGHPAESVRP